MANAPMYAVLERFSTFPATLVIIAINVIVFILIRTGKLSTAKLATSYLMTVKQRGFYRVVTSAFTQEEPLHLIMNMCSLYNLGEVLEPILGTMRFVIIYAVIMVAGGLLSNFVHRIKSPLARSIGASGVICGLLGVYIAIAVAFAGLSAIRSVLPSLAIMVLMTASKRIDSIGHFTGLFVGLVCGAVLVIPVM